jgi:hypothetical protein
MAHNHNNCSHSCDGHSNVDNSGELGIHYTLYTKINIDYVECLNEAVEGSGKLVFKSWDNRLDFEKVLKNFINYLLLSAKL